MKTSLKGYVVSRILNKKNIIFENKPSSKIKTNFLSLSILFFLFVFQQGFATDYYVSPNGDDTNDGSFSAPWRTIQYAVNFKDLKGGDTVFLRGGTYVESVTMTVSGNGTNRILVKNYPNETPIINGEGLNFDYNWQEYTGLFNIRGSYITIDGLKVINSDPPGQDAGNATGIVVRGPNVTDVTVRNCITENTRSSGIAIWGLTRGNDYSGCRNVIIEYCDISGAVRDGFNEHLTIAMGVENYTIRYNKVHDQTAVGREPNLPIGIDSKINVRNGKIYGNEVYNLRKSNGIYVDAWDSEAYNIEIYENIIHDIDHTGIPIGAEEGGTAHNIKVYNNLIYNTGWDGIAIPQANNTLVEGDNRVYDIEIYNNTIYGSGQYAMHIPNRNISNISILNNIFAENEWSNSTTYFLGSESNITMANNITFGNQNAFIEGMEYMLGDNAINEDPLFRNVPENDFRLQVSSPGVDAGSLSLFASKDLDGKNRSDGTPDIGAYETGDNGTGNDALLGLEASGTVVPGEDYVLVLEYEAEADRQIITEFQLAREPWTPYGTAIIDVAAGNGSTTVTIPVRNDVPIENEAYKWSAYIVPVGKNFNDNLSYLEKTGISVVDEQSNTFPDGVWYIENRSSNKRLGISACSTSFSEEIPLSLEPNEDQGCSVFEFVPTDTGYFFIQNLETKGRYRTKSCSATANDTVEVVQVGEGSYGWCEQWRLVDAGEGFYRIENRQTGQWLRPRGCASERNTPIVQVGTNYTGNCTKWTLVDATGTASALKVDFAQQDDLRIYPNPARGRLFVETFSGNKTIQGIVITDLQGRPILTARAEDIEEGMDNSVDVSGISDGLYILNLDFQDGTRHNAQIIIEN